MATVNTQIEQFIANHLKVEPAMQYYCRKSGRLSAHKECPYCDKLNIKIDYSQIRENKIIPIPYILNKPSYTYELYNKYHSTRGRLQLSYQEAINGTYLAPPRQRNILKLLCPIYAASKMQSNSSNGGSSIKRKLCDHCWDQLANIIVSPLKIKVYIDFDKVTFKQTGTRLWVRDGGVDGFSLMPVK